MLLELTQLPTEQGAAVRLMDQTTPDREPKDRTGIDLNDAMQNAFHEFAWYSELGRGFLLVRLPPTWPGGTRELPVIETGDAGEAVARRRLADLATALLVLSVVVPGVGEVSMVIGAAFAAERLIRRAENGTLRLDESAVSDTLAILGAVAQGAQLIGKLRIVRAGDAFVGALQAGDEAALKGAVEAFEAARKAGKVLSVTSTVINAGGVIWGDLVMIQQIVKLLQDEIDGKITHAEARRRTASMFASAVTNHGVMLAALCGREVQARPQAKRISRPKRWNLRAARRSLRRLFLKKSWRVEHRPARQLRAHRNPCNLCPRAFAHGSRHRMDCTRSTSSTTAQSTVALSRARKCAHGTATT